MPVVIRASKISEKIFVRITREMIEAEEEHKKNYDATGEHWIRQCINFVKRDTNNWNTQSSQSIRY